MKKILPKGLTKYVTRGTARPDLFICNAPRKNEAWRISQLIDHKPTINDILNNYSKLRGLVLPHECQNNLKINYIATT